MRTILTLTLFSTVLLFSHSLNASSRQAPSEKKQEKKGKWKAIATVHKGEGSVSCIFTGKGPLGLPVSSCTKNETDGVSASVVFTYEAIDDNDKPTPLSTTCSIKDRSEGTIVGSLNPEAGSRFNLLFTHTKGLSCSQKATSKIYFTKGELYNSAPFNITTNSNMGISGEVSATRVIVEKALINLGKEQTVTLVAKSGSMVFPSISSPLDEHFHEESYSTKKEQGSITYIYTGTVMINNHTREATSTVTSSINIVQDSLDYNPKEF